MNELPLVLRIENIDTLPDGGPVFFEIDRRGIDIGRDSYLDWTLPDAERFISGKHCEIHFRDGAYWLHDVSTNGTTVNGQSGRLTEPHRVSNGDRIHIGQYIIVAELIGEEGADAPAMRSSAHTSIGATSGDPWGNVSDAADAVDRRDFAAHATADAGPSVAHGSGDLAEENISWGVEDVVSSPASDADVDWTTPVSKPAASADEDFSWATPSPSTSSGETSPPDWRGAAPEELAPAEPAPAPELAAEPETDVSEPSASAFEQEADEEPEPPQVEPEPPQVEPEEPVATAEPGSDREEPASPEPFATPDFAEPEPEPVAVEPAPSAFEQPEAVAPEAPPDPAPIPAAESAPAQPSSDGLAGQWADGVQPATPKPAPVQAATPGPASATAASAGAFVAAFERGAGMPAGSVAGRGDEQFAEELGALFKTVTGNLQSMLLARAETKSAMRSSERTMIGALENNPLKFSPTPEDALRVMFGEKTRSYLDAAQTVDQSFGDLQKHQMQTFGAMQQALQALIEDLDPESIAGATSKDGGLAGLVSSRRAKFWDTYVERFSAKASRHERGMIDAFMILFAEMYDRQS